MAQSHPDRMSSEPSSPRCNWVAFLRLGSRLFWGKSIKVFSASLQLTRGKWKADCCGCAIKCLKEEWCKPFCTTGCSHVLHLIYIFFSTYATQPGSWMKWYHAPWSGNSCMGCVRGVSYEHTYRLIYMKIFMNFKSCRSSSNHMHTQKGIIQSLTHRGNYTAPFTRKKLVLY